MDVSKIKITEQDRILVSKFMGEDYPEEIDFNWLMPMIEKIESLDNVYQVQLNIGSNVTISSDAENDFVNYGNGILPAWETVVEFIQWYNNQKDSNV